MGSQDLKFAQFKLHCCITGLKTGQIEIVFFVTWGTLQCIWEGGGRHYSVFGHHLSFRAEHRSSERWFKMSAVYIPGPNASTDKITLLFIYTDCNTPR